MRKNQLYIFGFTFLITLCAGAFLFYEEGEYKPDAYANGESNQWTEWSQSLIELQKEGKDISGQLTFIQQFSASEIATDLTTDAQKKAFWINTYNALVQYQLGKHPELFENRSSFYSKTFLILKDVNLSLDDIEHGILRKSQLKLGLGYFTDPFPSSAEQILRVQTRDPRIHFALNCGAKSCPRIGNYAPETIENSLNESSRQFLNKESNIDPNTNTISTTPLFQWFQGDFGGTKGIYQLLVRFQLIEGGETPSIVYKEYDWTLTLNAYVED